MMDEDDIIRRAAENIYSRMVICYIRDTIANGMRPRVYNDKRAKMHRYWESVKVKVHEICEN
jgi:hypothetical protein